MVESLTVTETDTLEPDCFDNISVDRIKIRFKTETSGRYCVGVYMHHTSKLIHMLDHGCQTSPSLFP